MRKLPAPWTTYASSTWTLLSQATPKEQSENSMVGLAARYEYTNNTYTHKHPRHMPTNQTPMPIHRHASKSPFFVCARAVCTTTPDMGCPPSLARMELNGAEARATELSTLRCHATRERPRRPTLDVATVLHLRPRPSLSPSLSPCQRPCPLPCMRPSPSPLRWLPHAKRRHASAGRSTSCSRPWT